MRLPGSFLLTLFFTSVQISLQLDLLHEGDTCQNENGSYGVCKKASECATASLSIQSGTRPKICNFLTNQVVLCCLNEAQINHQQKYVHHSSGPSLSAPQDRNSRAAAIAKKKCVEYAKSVVIEVDSPVLASDGDEKETIDQCARIEEPLVVGGENAKPKEYPHMAQVGYGDGSRNNIEWLCGGSLISERFVISAAHCSHPGSKGPASWVKLGELDSSTNNDDADPVVIKIIKIINHPLYNPSGTLYNDLVLFKLESEVTFNAYIRPICLTTSSNLPIRTAIATGWGHTKWGGQASNSLLKVRLNLVDDINCNRKYRSISGSKLPQGVIKSQVCAGDEAGKDTCQGDSGGPLQSPLNEPYCMYELIGVTSFGNKCAVGYPGVYTRVSAFLPWIVENVWSE